MERPLQIKDRGLDEGFSKNVEDEILDEQDQFLSSQYFVDNHLLEYI